MLSEKLRNELNTEKLAGLLDQVDVHAVWRFIEEEAKIVTALLKSDSHMAFGVGAFIVSENSRYAEPLIPLLLEISGPRESKWGNRSRGFRGSELLLDVIFNKKILWRRDFLSCVIVGLNGSELFTRGTTIQLVMHRFDEVFPSVYHTATGEEFKDICSAKTVLAQKYEQVLEQIPNQKSYDGHEFMQIFQQDKRLFRALYFIALLKDSSLASPKEKVRDEDSFTFDYLQYSKHFGW